MQRTFRSDLLNTDYIAGCSRDGSSTSSPDCGHGDCGILCDRAMVATRRNGAVTEIVAEFHDAPTGGRRGLRYHAVRRLLHEGLHIAQIPALLELSINDVLRCLTDLDVTKVGMKILLAEALLRRGTSYREVQRRTGLSYRFAAALADHMGVSSDIATSLKAGGGSKFTAAQLAQVRELRSTGLAFAAIAKATGISPTRCSEICAA